MSSYLHHSFFQNNIRIITIFLLFFLAHHIYSTNESEYDTVIIISPPAKPGIPYTITDSLITVQYKITTNIPISNRDCSFNLFENEVKPTLDSLYLSADYKSDILLVLFYDKDNSEILKDTSFFIKAFNLILSPEVKLFSLSADVLSKFKNYIDKERKSKPNREFAFLFLTPFTRKHDNNIQVLVNTFHAPFGQLIYDTSQNHQLSGSYDIPKYYQFYHRKIFSETRIEKNKLILDIAQLLSNISFYYIKCDFLIVDSIKEDYLYRYHLSGIIKHFQVISDSFSLSKPPLQKKSTATPPNEDNKSITDKNFNLILTLYEKLKQQKNDSALRLQLQREIDTLSLTCLKNNTFSYIYTLGKKDDLKVFFNNNPSNRYVLARSCEANKDYATAVEYYQLLSSQSRDNPPVFTLEDINKRLQTLQKVSNTPNSLNERISGNQKLFDETGEKQYIIKVIKYSRCKYILPVIEMLARYVYEGGDPAILVNKFSQPNAEMPFYLESIFTVNQTCSINHILFHRKQSKIVCVKPELSDLVINDTYIHEKDGKVLLVRKLSKGNSIIIQFSLLPNPQEEYSVSDLLVKKQVYNSWYRIKEIEHLTGCRFISKTSSVLISLELAVKPDFSVEKFWNQMQFHSFIQYLVRYSKEGSISESKGLNLKQLSYDPAEWKKSISSNSIYLQEVTNMKGNRKITDIVQPLYKGTTWQGVLRIGFSNQ